MKNDPKFILNQYLPGPAVEKIYDLIVDNKVHLKITKSRRSKFGDYRPPIKNPYHRISVNHDLNKYNFLITLVHEIAHLKVWNQYKNKVKPHGKEWKEEFKLLMQDFLGNNIFPAELQAALNSYLKKAKASSTSDQELTKILLKYDPEKEDVILEELPSGSRFMVPGGRSFIKNEKVRTRFKCLCLDNNRVYLFNPVARVKPILENL